MKLMLDLIFMARGFPYTWPLDKQVTLIDPPKACNSMQLERGEDPRRGADVDKGWRRLPGLQGVNGRRG